QRSRTRARIKEQRHCHLARASQRTRPIQRTGRNQQSLDCHASRHHLRPAFAPEPYPGGSEEEEVNPSVADTDFAFSTLCGFARWVQTPVNLDALDQPTIKLPADLLCQRLNRSDHDILGTCVEEADAAGVYAAGFVTAFGYDPRRREVTIDI